MKVQKLGLVLGMNMAVACMVMQGCKANKPQQPPPPPDNGEVTVSEPTQPEAPKAVSGNSTITTKEIPQAPAPAPVVAQPVKPVEPPPSQVTDVKPLPPPVKPVAAPKPVAVKPVSATPAAPVSVYEVKRGDSISGISKRYNVKIDALVAANPGLNPDRIRFGQKLNIPGAVAKAADAAPKAETKTMLAAAPAPVAAPAAAANTTAPVKTKNAFKAYEGPTKDYTVRNGDTLGKIAYENGITIRALKALNGMQNDSVLRTGRTLKIPAEKVVAAKPVASAKPADAAAKPADKAAPAPKAQENKAQDVKKPEAKPADAAAKPAEAAAKPADAAKPAEAAKPADAAKPAEAVKPADAAKPAEAAAEKKEEVKEEAPAATGPTYTVKDGDDVVSVAINWGISPSQLMNLNDLKAGDPIKPGQVLKLPANAKQAN